VIYRELLYPKGPCRRRGCGLDARSCRRDVATIANVVDFDSDAKFDTFFPRYAGIASGHAPLDIHRATHRVNGVPGVLDDTPAVLCDLGI
jgi:hypothetical protein